LNVLTTTTTCSLAFYVDEPVPENIHSFADYYSMTCLVVKAILVIFECFSCFYFTPKMFVCPLIYLINHGWTCVHIDYGFGSVLLWRHCTTVCTFGFVDDVMFSHNGPYGTSCVYL